MRHARQSTIAMVIALCMTRPGSAQEIRELPAEDRFIDATFETLYEIGAVDGAEWETFGRISGLGFDEEGLLHIFDRSSARVATVSTAGELVRRWGRQGDGPGEFRRPSNFAVFRDGRSVVSDPGHGRYLLFDARGRFDRSVPIPTTAGVQITPTLVADPRGETVLLALPGAIMPHLAQEVSDGRPIRRATLDDDGAESTAYLAWSPPPRPVVETELEGMRIPRPVERAFEPALLFGVQPDGTIAVVDSVAYRIKLVDAASGRARAIVARPIAPLMVDDRLRDRAREERLAELARAGGSRVTISVDRPGGGSRDVNREEVERSHREALESMEFMSEVPVVSDLGVDWVGSIWVQRSPLPGDPPGPIDLLGPDGSYVGTLSGVEMPHAFGPDGLVAWIFRDEFDVAHIRVARLAPQPG